MSKFNFWAITKVFEEALNAIKLLVLSVGYSEQDIWLILSTLIFILGYVDQAKEEGAEIFQTEVPEALKANKGLYYPPTLITHVNAASTVVMEEIFGPVAVALPFRY